MKLALVTSALFLISAGHALAGAGEQSGGPNSGVRAVLEKRNAQCLSLTEREGDF